MAKRIHELAKEWGLPTKELLARIAELGITGKRSQSSLADADLGRVQTAVGRGSDASIRVGDERVVGERVVTERDSEGEVTTRERIVEARVGTNVIRRRRKKVEVIERKEISATDAGNLDDGSLLDLPEMPPAPLETPADDGLLPPEAEAAPMLGDDSSADDDAALLDLPEPEKPVVEESAPEAPEAPEAPVEVVADADPAEAPKEAPPAEVPAEAVAEASATEIAIEPEPAATTPARQTRTVAPRIDPTAPSLDDGMRRVQVLGKIDLKKAEPPPRPSRPGPGGAAPTGVATPGTGTDDTPRRRKGKKVIRKPGQFDPFSERKGGRMGRKPQKKRAAPGKEQRRTEITTPSARKRQVRISEGITVGELAKAMGLKAGEVIKKLMEMGVMATMNHFLDADHATLVASEFEYTVENVAFDAEKEIEGTAAEETKGESGPRDPVVTVMGHVDHGKTSLLDYIREARVADGEAGGITQHMGAYTADVNGRRIAFLDTPGHEAFTSMRARGAKVTDIVILVVAADDGVMPQTVEAINHSRAAEVPVIVAVNKIDRPDADLEKVKQGLSDNGLVPEDWGGDTTFVPVSAKTGEGVDQLLEMVLLQADLMDLKANPEIRARGSVVEAKLDRGRGPVATVLIQEGTLRAGDPFVVGLQHGRLRAMLDWQGRPVKEAGPSTPVSILGLSGVPAAGDSFAGVADDATARQVAEHRSDKQRQAELSKPAKVSLDDLYKQLESDAAKELRVVLKVDVQGSIDALTDAFTRLANEEVKVSTIHASVGGITESDVLLASASNAVIIGFNVRPEPKAGKLAEREGVDLRLYTIIYDAINQVRDALEGMLSPAVRERTVGRAEVREIFGVSGAGVIAGSSVNDGKILRGGLARLLRDHAVVHEGKIGSLRRFKDDVREVASGYECGIGLEGFNDLKPGDVIEVYELEEVARKLPPPSPSGNQPSAASVA
ncbi:MAG: translation initiation factor IF-2 [Candidatus Binatia bacterium]|nr:translation initiation factor IF-2 [Candidatus Binatia bacterium]